MSSFLNSVRKCPDSPIIQRLVELAVNYQQTNQNDAATTNTTSMDINKQLEKKIKALIKQIRKLKQAGSVEILEQAILHKDPRTRCVLIRRSTEGTPEQLARSNPAVEYCRLWRWPNLNNQNELKPVDFCPAPFHYNLDTICINPFHYERVPTTYSVYVPRFSSQSLNTISELRTASMNDRTISEIPQNTTYENPVLRQVSSPASVNSQESFHSPSDGGNSEENYEPVTPMDMDTSQINPPSPPPPPGQNMPWELVPFEELREWCGISYYERANRVGEQFRATQSEVIIDGFTNTSSAGRFCLGTLSNVHRTGESDRVRRHIRGGVKLYNVRGNVYAECMSENPVFVQSPIANRRFDWHPATVCKIPPTVRLKIFDSDDFTEVLRNAVNESYESVYNLVRMCIIRLSFVKGWGSAYPLQTVTATPCWVEIHLDGPLKWLDTVLSTMRGPTMSINSVS